MKPIFKILGALPARASILLIRGYRALLSPDTGLPRVLGMRRTATCGFYPTCSVYAQEAIEKHGFFKGWRLAVRRIARCHPWSESKVDKVP